MESKKPHSFFENKSNLSEYSTIKVKDTDYPRTTLFIVDRNEWVSAKSVSEKLGYNSVSEYIFDLLRADKDHKILYYSLFIELEKYYELEYYTLGLTADRAGFPERVLIDIMEKFNLPFSENKKIENTKRIHQLLLEYRLVPREVENIIRLKKESNRREILSESDMLFCFFPDNQERTTELLTIVRDEIMSFVDSHDIRKLCKSCKETATCRKKYLDFRSIFMKFGLDFDEEAINSEPIIETLRKNDCIQLFGQTLEYCALTLISRELERLENFQTDYNIIMEPTNLQQDKKRIIQRQEQIAKEASYIFTNLWKQINTEKLVSGE